MARKKGDVANIAECSTYTWTFCEKEKRIIGKKQDQHKEKTGLFLSMERAVKHIINEWEERA